MKHLLSTISEKLLDVQHNDRYKKESSQFRLGYIQACLDLIDILEEENGKI